jgi:hypothetical protein
LHHLPVLEVHLYYIQWSSNKLVWADQFDRYAVKIALPQQAVPKRYVLTQEFRPIPSVSLDTIRKVSARS